MTIFGRFLEISIPADHVYASVQFYERLGFRQLQCNDTWPHLYGVLSDGRLCIGLHQRTGGTPALSFVRPGLAQHLHELQVAGFEPHYTRLGEDDFHELQLRDPSGQDVVLLEARTFSPGRSHQLESACGYFAAYSMPATDFEAAQAFWEHAGFVALEAQDEPYAHVPLTSDHLNLALHRPRLLEAPALVFTDPEMNARITRLRAMELPFSPDLPRGLDRDHNAMLVAPEGTLLLLLQAAL
jgi:hypothetical protein